MDATEIDPRYTNHLQDIPAYRVDFWFGDSGSHEWRLTGARDFDEVLAWAHGNAGTRDIVIYVEVNYEQSVALARIYGSEPA